MTSAATNVSSGASGPAVPPPPARDPEPGPAPPSGGAAPPRRPPRTVWLATLLFALVAALWTVAVPAFRAPDEAAHLDLTLHLAAGHGYPSYDGRLFAKVMAFDAEGRPVPFAEPWPRFDLADAPPRADRPDAGDLEAATAGPAPRRVEDRFTRGPYTYELQYNQMPQHPPLYYLGAATLLRLERWLLPGRDLPGVDRELGLLRLANVALVAPLPLLAWATTVRLGGGDRAGRVAALLPLGLPQLTHIGSVLNNDNLLVLLGGVLAVLLAGVARGRRSRRTDLGVGVVVGLALLTKGLAVMFLPWVLVAYGVGAWTTRGRRAAAVGALVALGTALAVGAWWWVGNWVRVGEPAPTTETLTITSDERPPGFEPDAVGYAFTFAGRMVARTWAWVGYGSPKVQLPMGVVVVLTLAAAAAVAVAARTATRGRDPTAGPRRWDVALAWAGVLFTLVFVARRGWGLHVTNGGLPFIQGRYLFAVLVAPIAVVAVGAARALGTRVVGVALALVAGVQAWVLAEVVGASWSGPGALGPLQSALAWGPWPPGLVGAVAVAAVATVAALIAAELGADVARGGPDPPQVAS